jgi:hypothetical protein
MHNHARLGVVAPQVLADVYTEESQRDLLALMRAHLDKAKRHGIECEWATQLAESCALYEAALCGAQEESPSPLLRLVQD